MNVCTIDDQLAEVLDVGLINSFGIGQDLGDVYWDSHLKIEIMCVSNLHYWPLENMLSLHFPFFQQTTISRHNRFERWPSLQPGKVKCQVRLFDGKTNWNFFQKLTHLKTCQKTLPARSEDWDLGRWLCGSKNRLVFRTSFPWIVPASPSTVEWNLERTFSGLCRQEFLTTDC